MASSLRRAAIVLTSLPKADAKRMLATLSARQRRAILAEVRRLGRSDLGRPAEEPWSAIVSAFTREAAAPADVAQDGHGDPSRFPCNSVKQTILDRPPFEFLSEVKPPRLAQVLRGELPQTVALVLSHLPPAVAAEVLGGLRPELQQAVVLRIAAMQQPAPEMVAHVESGLASLLRSGRQRQPAPIGGVDRAAKILGRCDPATEAAVLVEMSQDFPELANSLRQHVQSPAAA